MFISYFSFIGFEYSIDSKNKDLVNERNII